MAIVVIEALFAPLTGFGLGRGLRGLIKGGRLLCRRQQVVQVRLEQTLHGPTWKEGLPLRDQRIAGPVEREVEKWCARLGGRSRRSLPGEADDPLDPFARELARRKVIHRRRFQGLPIQGIASRDGGGPPLPPTASPPPRTTLVSRALRAFPLAPHPGRRVLRWSSHQGLVRAPGGNRTWLSNHLPYGSRLRSLTLSARSIAAVHSRQDGPVRRASPLTSLRGPGTKLSTYVLIWSHVTGLARRIRPIHR